MNFNLSPNKFHFIFLFLVIVNFSIAQEFDPFNKLVEQEKLSALGKMHLAPTSTGNDFNVHYARCEWTVDPAVLTISGKITSYFKVTTGPLNMIEFDLSSALLVDSILYHNSALLFNHTNEIVSCSLPNALSVNINDSIAIYYHGVPPSTGFGSFNQTTHAGASIIWTLSEPYGASDWWPCKNSLIDKIDSIEIIATVPQGNKVASNGLLISETAAGNNTIVHWKSRYPIATYLVAISVTNYAAYSNYVTMGPNDSLEVLNYVYPENLLTWQSTTPDIISTIQLYDSLIIPYPFKEEKYGHAQFGWGGGMEHQTMSFIVNTGHALMAHECAHQWFGDHVTTGSWEDIWLNEGFATYMEGLTEQYLYPQDWFIWKQGKINSITSVASGSVKCTDTTNLSRIFSSRLTYNKGAYLLHMLRWQIGDSAFFQGLRNYLNDPLLSQNFARTSQFKLHMEQSSGQNLTTFFDQWYNGEGYPTYSIFWSNSTGLVNIQIDQITSHPSISFYTMPLPIKLSDGINDTTVICQNTFSGQNFTFPLSFTPTTLEFDPELWILSTNNTTFTGLTEEDKSIAVSIYPNPISDVVKIVFADKYPSQILIQDLSGRVVKIVDVSENAIQIDCSMLTNQPYLLRYSINGSSFTKKLIICRTSNP